jgi:hypothetical protein
MLPLTLQVADALQLGSSPSMVANGLLELVIALVVHFLAKEAV